MKIKGDPKVTTWRCPHCDLVIRVQDPIDVVDHCIDEHVEILIRDRPVFPLVTGVDRRP